MSTLKTEEKKMVFSCCKGCLIMLFLIISCSSSNYHESGRLVIMNPKSEKDDFRGKKEIISDPNYSKFPKNNIISSSSSRQWSSTYKNPRIVRVSRAFGGKDRHSKVCTVRGLRDRRIRLSVPTAIQLYDLQDRLGLSQPSKVVDWLIDATKHEIDKLPPLPMLPISHDFLNSDHTNKELGVKMSTDHNHREKEKWIVDQQENQDQGFGGFNQNYQLFPLFGNNSIQSSCNFPNMPYNFHWDPPSLSLSQFGGGYPAFPINQTEDNPSGSQLQFLPSATNLPSMIPTFPSFLTPSMDNHDLRQINHVQQNSSLLPTTLHLISSPMKSFMLNVKENHGGRVPEKDRRNS